MMVFVELPFVCYHLDTYRLKRSALPVPPFQGATF
jgi:hypothetical protein